MTSRATCAAIVPIESGATTQSATFGPKMTLHALFPHQVREVTGEALRVVRCGKSGRLDQTVHRTFIGQVPRHGEDSEEGTLF